MLKNRKAIYVLVPLNLLIWGYFVSSFLVKESVVRPQVTTSVSAGNIDNIAGGYKLVLGYPDSFLKNNSPAKQNLTVGSGDLSSSSKKGDMTRTLEPKSLKIDYNGLVSNLSNGLTMALVTINGESRVVRKGDHLAGYIATAIVKDSIVLRRKGETLSIRK